MAVSAKADTFLDAVRRDEMAADWELIVTVGDQPTPMYFTGGHTKDNKLLIIGATTRGGIDRFCDELLTTGTEYATHCPSPDEKARTEGPRRERARQRLVR